MSEEIVAFGRHLHRDPLNSITQVDNDTVIIKPLFNTSGLVELRVGVLLPFSQTNDNLTEEIVWGGLSAIRMAVNMINQQQIIPGAYVTLIQKDSYPNENAEGQEAVTQAVYGSVTLLQQGVIGVIGDISSSWTTLSALITSTLEIPQCSFTANAIGFSDKSQYKYFYRTIPTKATLADVMLDFIGSQGWKHIGVIYSNDPLGQQFYQKILMQADYRDVNVISYQPFLPEDIAGLLKFVKSSAIRIVVVGVTGTDQIQLMKRAVEMGLVSNEYVWLLMDDNSPGLLHAAEDLGNVRSMDGVISFDMKMSLYGYPPFEAFLDQWTQLNPTTFPYAGRRNVTTNEGPAYSCMMTMARGFNRTVSQLEDPNLGLRMLANRSLGASMVPITFDTDYLSPEGPLDYDSNGDLLTGNHHILNIQYGDRVSIGHSIARRLQLTQPPVYHGGSYKPPADSPPSYAMNPDFSHLPSQVILTITLTGMLFSVLVLMLVVSYRKYDIFRASSPLFLVFELVGFLFTYVSVIFLLNIPTRVSCLVVPITFNLGYLLVLGNMIAKNYRIYRIFNNIFISQTVLTDSKLMKSLSAVITVDMVILIISLIVSVPEPKLVQVSPTSHYWICEAKPTVIRTTLLSIGAAYAGIMLLFATFLAHKTRSAGKHYDRYNECKQMGISVYNILFSALVGVAAMANPLSNYYLRFYSVVITILWATTFSLAVLFIPKLYVFYKQWKKTPTKETNISAEDLASPTDTAGPLFSFGASDNNLTVHSFLKSSSSSATAIHNGEEQDTATATKSNMTHAPVKGKSYSLSSIFDPSLEMESIKIIPAIEVNGTAEEFIDTETVENTNVYVEVQEGDLPVRRAFRYFPFLSQWKMRRLMIFPRFGYISYYSEKSKKGTMISYSHATVHSAANEEYVLKIHGLDEHDVYIQLGDLATMESWQTYLNQDVMKQMDDCSSLVNETISY